jgi:hypothetical protein
VIQEGPPRIHGVERILGEDEGAARRGRPGVDQRDLDDVGGVVQPRDVAPRLVVDEPDARIAIEMSGEVAEPLVDEFDDPLVDLHPNH